MSEDPRYGPNWRSNPRMVTAFRRLATTERRQDNEAIAAGNPNALARIEARFGRDWRESMEARRELRRLDRRSGRRGGGRVQRGRSGHLNTPCKILIPILIQVMTYFIIKRWLQHMK